MKSIRTLAIIASLFAITIPAAAQKDRTPLELYDYIVATTDSLYMNGKKWGSQFTSCYKSKAYDSLTPIRLECEMFVQKRLAEFKKMKDIKGSTKLRLAYIDMLIYEAKLVRATFIPFEDFTLSTPDQTVKDAIKRMNEVARNETDYLKKINIALDEYAELNGFLDKN